MGSPKRAAVERAVLLGLALGTVPATGLGAGLGTLACTMQPIVDDAQAPALVYQTRAQTQITPAPPRLRGRVALPAGARLYARPDYTSPSWELRLTGTPLGTADAPPRARAFRVVGIVEDPYTGDFLAVTNALASADDPEAQVDPNTQLPVGCGPAIAALPHLRVLLYVPLIYTAEVTTRTLELELHSPAGELELVHLGAGVRVGPPSTTGMPPPAAGSSWRWLDADGIRVVAPIPDNAVGLAWDPRERPTLRDAGERLLRDADGSIMWLRDEGGASVELSFRNACGEYRRRVEDPAEVESLRALALDLFYDQSPAAETLPASPPDADFMIAANTPLRWPDGGLAGEILHEWAVEVGVGRTWDDRRCFSLELGNELVPIDEPGLACVNPEALTPMELGAGGFSVSDELELGGSIVLGPAEALSGDWDGVDLRTLLNARHESSAECLRTLLVTQAHVDDSRWLLDLLVDAAGQVSEVALTALGLSGEAVEDCLEAEAYTWMFPGGEGQLRVPVTLGDWSGDPQEDSNMDFAADPPDETPQFDDAPERGKVIYIRDEE